MCWSFHFPFVLRISFSNTVSQLFLFAHLVGRGGGGGVGSKVSSLEWRLAEWVGRGWNRLSGKAGHFAGSSYSHPTVEWLPGQFTWRLQGRVSEPLREDGMSSTYSCRGGGCCQNTGRYPLGSLLQELTKQAWDQALRLVTGFYSPCLPNKKNWMLANLQSTDSATEFSLLILTYWII